MREHAEGARRLGLWLALACNVIDGGDGSSGWPGGTTSNGSQLWNMSPTEAQDCIVEGAKQAPCIMGGFRWDTQYLTKPGVRSALDEGARIARTYPRDCTR
jgi:hypothetical protein